MFSCNLQRTCLNRFYYINGGDTLSKMIFPLRLVFEECNNIITFIFKQRVFSFYGKHFFSTTCFVYVETSFRTTLYLRRKKYLINNLMIITSEINNTNFFSSIKYVLKIKNFMLVSIHRS